MKEINKHASELAKLSVKKQREVLGEEGYKEDMKRRRHTALDKKNGKE